MSREEDLTLNLNVDDSDVDKLEHATDVVDDLEGREVDIPIDTSGADNMVDALGDVTQAAGTAETAISGIEGAAGSVGAANREWVDQFFRDTDALKQQAAEVAETLERAGAKGGEGLQQVAKGAGDAKGQLGNVVGNAAGDLGQLAGVSGTAGQALGQLAEQAATGGASLAALGPAAAVAAGVGVVMWGIQKSAEKAKKAAEDLKDAMVDLGRVADEEVLDTFNRMVVDTVKSGKNLNDVLKDLAEQQPENARRTLELMDADGRYTKVADALRQTLAEADAQQQQNTLTKQTYGDASEAAAAADEKQAEAAQAVTDAAKEQADQLLANADAMRAAADAGFALHDAQKNLNDAVAELPQKLAEAGGDLLAAQQALDGVAQSAGGVADAQVRLADEQAKASGSTLDATAKLDAWNASMLDQASAVNGPARTAILNYIGAVNNIPPEKLTEIQALLDQGKVDEAKKAIDDASKNRTATVTAQAVTATADAQLDAVAEKKRVATIAVQVAAEAVSSKISGILQRAVQGTQTINVNVPRGARQGEIAAAVNAMTRRSGARFGTPSVRHARR